MSTSHTLPSDQYWETEVHDHPEGFSTPLGFWIYLMSDCLMFAVLFAVYAVQGGATAGGPGPKELFELWIVALNTGLLLCSSITYGFAMLEMVKGNQKGMLNWLGITLLFGLGFLFFEVYEFYHLIHEGAGPDRSGFLSAFFALVGTHGLHVTFGCLWLVVLMVQVKAKGLIPANQRRLMCLSMFWHFLDVIWIGVFTFVYLVRMI